MNASALDQLADEEELRRTGGDGRDGIDELNDSHLVTRQGGRTLILRREQDPGVGRASYVPVRQEDLKLYYANRMVEVGRTEKGAAIMKPLATAWLQSPRRSTYSDLVMDPSRSPNDRNVFNLWKGWGVQPKQGSWDTIRNHLFEVVCSSNHETFAYLLGWMAFVVQHPAQRPEVAIVMRGGKGCGKGVAVAPLMRIFGEHALHLTQAKHLVGNFNGHLLDALLVFADESFWAGDRQHESALKGLVTEPQLMIERKGVDAFVAPNRVKLIMASNADWVVPASTDERRFLLLDVSPARTGDRAYFSELWRAVEGDEPAAMLAELLLEDLASFEIRDVPRTKALAEQILISADSVTRWWHHCLSVQTIKSGSDGWPTEIDKGELRKAYWAWCQHNVERYPLGEALITKKLAEVWPGGKVCDVRPSDPAGGTRPRLYRIKPLDEHREAFARSFRLSVDELWPDNQEAE